MDKTVKQVLKLLQSSDSSNAELHDLIMSIPIFNRLFRRFSYMTRLSLITNLAVAEFQDSETIFNYGDFFDSILVLVQGSVLQYSAHNEFYLEPVKLINDAYTRTRIHPNNAMAKGNCVVLKLSLEVYNEITLDEIETTVKEKIKYVEGLIPGISSCTNAQKEKIAYSMEIVTLQKGFTLCYEGKILDKLQIVLEGECAVVKFCAGRLRTISKLCKGSFISENNVINGSPTEYSVIVSSDKVKIGKFKNSDIKNNFPSHVLLGIKNIHGIKEKMHDKILKFPKLVASISVPAKSFPLASPKTLNKIALFNFRQSFGSSPTDIKPKFKNELERLRDSSPLRINKFY